MMLVPSQPPRPSSTPPTTPTHTSIPPLLLFPCVACRMLRRHLDFFCCESHFGLCTICCSHFQSHSRLSRLAPLPLPCGCNVQCLSSHHPTTIHFVLCNHSFLSLSHLSHCIRLSLSYVATTVYITLPHFFPLVFAYPQWTCVTPHSPT